MAPRRKPMADRIKEKVRVEDGCWLWTGCQTRDGYGVLTSGRAKQLRAHRVSFETFVGPIPPGLMVCHRCDRPSCVNPEHLFVGTPRDNMHDKIRKGRTVVPRGQFHGNSKLTDAQRDELVELRSSGWLLTQLAERYGVTFQTVSMIYKTRTLHNARQ